MSFGLACQGYVTRTDDGADEVGIESFSVDVDLFVFRMNKYISIYEPKFRDLLKHSASPIQLLSRSFTLIPLLTATLLSSVDIITSAAVAVASATAPSLSCLSGPFPKGMAACGRGSIDGLGLPTMLAGYCEVYTELRARSGLKCIALKAGLTPVVVGVCTKSGGGEVEYAFAC